MEASSSASNVESLVTSISCPSPRGSIPCTPCADAAPTICGQLQVGHTSVEIDSFIKLNANHSVNFGQPRRKAPDVHPALSVKIRVMPLPMLNSRHDPSASDLIRLFHKTENLWSEHLAAAEALDVGTAYANAELGEVWDANCL